MGIKAHHQMLDDDKAAEERGEFAPEDRGSILRYAFVNCLLRDQHGLSAIALAIEKGATKRARSCAQRRLAVYPRRRFRGMSSWARLVAGRAARELRCPRHHGYSQHLVRGQVPQCEADGGVYVKRMGRPARRAFKRVVRCAALPKVDIYKPLRVVDNGVGAGVYAWIQSVVPARRAGSCTCVRCASSAPQCRRRSTTCSTTTSLRRSCCCARRG
jgi:hypothetical protein